MSYTKFAVKGTAIVLSISLVAGALGYVTRVILARNLTVEEFGLFYAIFAFLGLIGIFKSLGFDKALAKFIPEFNHKKENNFIKSSIIYVTLIQLITNTIIIIAVYLFSDFLATHYFQNNQASLILRLMAIAFFIDSFIQILKTSFQGFKKMAYFSGIDFIRMILIIAFILIGLKLNYGILSPVYAYILTPIILTILFTTILIKKVFPKFSTSKFTINKLLLKKISHYSIFILATTVGGIILGYTDIIMITYFLGLTSVALYSVALPTAKVLIFFPRAISGVLLPLTSELWSKKEENLLKEGMQSLYKYSMIIIVPLVFMVFSFSDLIINVFFGSNYISATNPMRILSIGMIFATMSGICSNFFSGIGKPQIASKMVYIAAIFNVITNFILIPMLGIIGAAITTTLSYLIMMFIGLIKMRKFIKIVFPIRVWSKTLASGIIYVLIIALLKEVIILNIFAEAVIVLVIAGASYITLLFLSKTLNKEEVKDLYKRIVK